MNIHPTACIEPGTFVHPTATVGAFTVIERDSSVHAHARVGAGCTIGRFSLVGSETKIGDGAKLLGANHLCYRAQVEAGATLHIGQKVGQYQLHKADP